RNNRVACSRREAGRDEAGECTSALYGGSRTSTHHKPHDPPDPFILGWTDRGHQSRTCTNGECCGAAIEQIGDKGAVIGKHFHHGSHTEADKRGNRSHPPEALTQRKQSEMRGDPRYKQWDENPESGAGTKPYTECNGAYCFDVHFHSLSLKKIR